MINYAVIGRGIIVDCFISGAKISGKMSLEAVFSRNYDTGKEFALKHGCSKVYTSLTDLANDKNIDAVYIASPNSCHYEQSKKLLESGKHILCEKPITTCSAEYIKLKKLADRLGLVYMEAIIPLYNNSRENIKEAIKEIGNITIAKFDYCQRSSRYDDFMKGKQINIFDMSLAAGTLMDLGVYCVYAAVDLFGVPKEIKAAKSTLKNGADGSGAAIFNYNDFTAVLTYSKIGQSVTSCEIIGDEGSIVIDRIGLYLGAYLIKCGKKIPLFVETEKDVLMSYEASAFCDFIDGKGLEIYNKSSEICRDVHKCMDLIKLNANIEYK